MKSISQKNEPNKIILHCSDTPDSGDKFGIDQIREWHLKERHWLDVGYHYVIRRSGLVEIGRPENVIGAHTQGNNENSLGICYIGTKKMTIFQIKALITLFKSINTRHKISFNEVYGHYEFNDGKTCPGQDMNVIRFLLEIMAYQDQQAYLLP